MKNDLQIYSTLSVLCVEDDESILNIYKEMFSIFFKQVFFAKNGEEGYKLFLDNNVDIVLTDYNMPRMNGLEMSRKIRSEDPTIPIVMVTALENLEILKEAIDLNINGFIKKPLSADAMFSTLEFVAKSVLANRLLLKEQSKKIEYNTYQESLTYKKEQVIIKNDFICDKTIADFYCDVFFSPKDTLSGDSYSLRHFSENKSLCFIIDGMGKGISASITAMMCCAYLNHLVDTKDMSLLEEIILELVAFIGKNLFEDEVVSATFLLFDEEKKRLHYAMFSMPALLYTIQGDENVLKIKSNNPPLASYTKKVNVSTINIHEMTKLLCFSDGLNENSLKKSNENYGKQLAKDFGESSTIQEFERKRKESMAEQEDDITYFFFSKKYRDDLLEVYRECYPDDDFLKNFVHCSKKPIAKNEFATSLKNVDNALEWYENICKEFFQDNIQELDKLSVAYTELYMNAYEHGNLGMDGEKKQRYLQNDTYFDKLKEMEQQCAKKIVVEVYKCSEKDREYLATQICDEGEGFDRKGIERLYRNTHNVYGRGIYISHQNSQKLYYNEKGNCVLFFQRIK